MEEKGRMDKWKRTKYGEMEEEERINKWKRREEWGKWKRKEEWIDGRGRKRE